VDFKFSSFFFQDSVFFRTQEVHKIAVFQISLCCVLCAFITGFLRCTVFCESSPEVSVTNERLPLSQQLLDKWPFIKFKILLGLPVHSQQAVLIENT